MLVVTDIKLPKTCRYTSYVDHVRTKFHKHNFSSIIVIAINIKSIRQSRNQTFLFDGKLRKPFDSAQKPMHIHIQLYIYIFVHFIKIQVSCDDVVSLRKWFRTFQVAL